jgi:hypothetical protein
MMIECCGEEEECDALTRSTPTHPRPTEQKKKKKTKRRRKRRKKKRRRRKKREKKEKKRRREKDDVYGIIILRIIPVIPWW